MSPVPYVPDPVVIMSLLMESVELGHTEPGEGFAWAEENGYIETGVDDDGEEIFRILEPGREHVASRVIVPEWN